MDAESDERRTAAGATAVDPATGRSRKGALPDHPAAGGEEQGDAEPQDHPRHHALGSRAPDFIKASWALHLAWKIGVFAVGLAVVGGGIVLLPLPGPGWLVIFGGIGIWATEFVWAQLVLRWTKRKVTEAAQRALDPKVRRRNIIITGIVLAILAAGLALYLDNFGFVLPWNIDG